MYVMRIREVSRIGAFCSHNDFCAGLYGYYRIEGHMTKCNLVLEYMPGGSLHTILCAKTIVFVFMKKCLSQTTANANQHLQIRLTLQRTRTMWRKCFHGYARQRLA